MTQIEPWKPEAAMTVAELVSVRDVLDVACRNAMRPDVDYGEIPGVKGKTLLKPGAERLLQLFGLSHDFEVVDVERDDQGRRRGVTVKCVVTKGDLHIASSFGSADYDEDRYYQSVAQLEERERANARKYRREPNPAKWAEPFRAPWNTVLKMAQKRALVTAAIQATGASGMFTADMEDGDSGGKSGADPTVVVAQACRQLAERVCGEHRAQVLREVGGRMRRPSDTDPWTMTEWLESLVLVGATMERLAGSGAVQGPEEASGDVEDARGASGPQAAFEPGEEPF